MDVLYSRVVRCEDMSTDQTGTLCNFEEEIQTQIFSNSDFYNINEAITQIEK